MKREDLFAIAEQAGFRCIDSCCSVPLKVCSLDKWQGDLCALATAIERHVLATATRTGLDQKMKYQNADLLASDDILYRLRKEQHERKTALDAARAASYGMSTRDDDHVHELTKAAADEIQRLRGLIAQADSLTDRSAK